MKCEKTVIKCLPRKFNNKIKTFGMLTIKHQVTRKIQAVATMNHLVINPNLKKSIK